MALYQISLTPSGTTNTGSIIVFVDAASATAAGNYVSEVYPGYVSGSITMATAQDPFSYNGQLFKMSTGSFNGKTASLDTLLFAVPAGKTLVITDCYMNVVSYTGGPITTALALQIGTVAQNYLDANWNINFAGTQTTDTSTNYRFTQASQSISGLKISGRIAGAVNVYAHVGTACVGPTTYTVNVDAFGYLI